MTNKRTRSLRGFTIIELMVVISLILLIISFLLPSFASVRDRARRVKWFSFANGLRSDADYLVYYPMFHKTKKVIKTNIPPDPTTYTNVAVLRNMATLDPNTLTGAYDVEPEDYDGIAWIGPSLYALSSSMWTDGRWDNKWGLSFSGAGEYLVAEIVPPLTNASTWMWIRTSDPNCGLFQQTNTKQGNRYDRLLWLSNNGKINARIWNNESIRGSTKINDDQWHLIVHTYSEANGQRIWVDGKIEVTGNKGKSDDNQHTMIHIGYAQDATNKSYWGMIDEFALVKRELDASEVTGIYNAGFRGRRR